MKRLLMILLSLMVLTVAGCSNSEDISTETTAGYGETTETAEQTETVVAESEATEITERDTETDTEEPYLSSEDVKEENSDAQSQKPEETLKPTVESKEEQPKEEASEPTPETTEAPTEVSQLEPEQPAQAVGYNPQNVVSLAIAKCQAGGMITTQDNLANALAEGRITQEEYDEYYCMMDLDEDEVYRIFVSGQKRCPYYRQGDDYTLARRQ